MSDRKPRFRHRSPPSTTRPTLAAPTAKPAADEQQARASYEVGYGKPPTHSRFKPGQSGNPKGRPRGSKSLSTLMRDIMNEKVVVRMPRGVRKITHLEAIVRRLLEQAARGDQRAIVQLLSQHRVLVPEPSAAEQSSASFPDTSQSDQEILAEWEASIRDDRDTHREEDR